VAQNRHRPLTPIVPSPTPPLPIHLTSTSKFETSSILASFVRSQVIKNRNQCSYYSIVHFWRNIHSILFFISNEEQGNAVMGRLTVCFLSPDSHDMRPTWNPPQVTRTFSIASSPFATHREAALSDVLVRLTVQCGVAGMKSAPVEIWKCKGTHYAKKHS
jgi:hypothetical protein